MHHATTDGNSVDKMQPPARRTAPGEENRYRDLLIVFVLAASLHTGFSLRSFGDAEHRQMEEDSFGYRTLANNLLSGQGFGRMKPVGPLGEELWTPEFCRTPGYPALIVGLGWLTGHGQTATIIFQQILGVVLCLMVMLICQRHFGRKAGLVAGCLLALDLQAIGLSNILLADFVFSFLLCSSVLLATRCVEVGSIGLGVGAGLLLGVSILVKPAGIYLPFVLSAVLTIYALVRHRRHVISAAIVMCLFAYLPVAGWVIRNGIVCGEYAFCAIPQLAPLNLAGGALAQSEGISQPRAHEMILTKAKTQATYQQLRHTRVPREELSKIRAVASSVVRENKTILMQQWAISSAKLLFGPEKLTLLALGLPHIALGIQGNATGRNDVSAASVVVLAWETLVLGSTYVMLLMTLWRGMKLRRLPNLVLFCLTVALPIMLLSSMPGGGDPRYRAQVVPLLVVAAAAGFGLNRPSELAHMKEVHQ